MKKLLFIIILGLSIFSLNSQTLNSTYELTAPGAADSFLGGYTFSYRTAGTPWNGALISFGGFANTYDTQLSGSYEYNRISFRTRNGDANVWNSWQELATKGANDFVGDQNISGNVGIGTNNPIEKLNINGGTGDGPLFAAKMAFTKVSSTGNVQSAKIVLNDDDTNWGNLTFKVKTTASRSEYEIFYTDALTIKGSNANVGIGTTNPDSKLTVAGNIHAREVKVTINAGDVPDYVFANDYKLKSLQEVEDYIKHNSHLPEIPSASEIEKNGLMLAEMNLSLLKKVEELTLYVIEQNKRIEKLEKEKK